MLNSRRLFLAQSTTLAVGTLTASIAYAQKSEESELYNITAEYQDTHTDWRGNNSETLIVRAEDYIIGSVQGLVADEGGDHKHTFDVTADDMKKLKNGETVQIRTTEKYGHTHLITIDPLNFKVPNGKIISVKEVIAD